MAYSAANTHAEWAASSWTDSGTDEYEPTKQSEDGCRTVRSVHGVHKQRAVGWARAGWVDRSDIASLARSEVEPTIPKPFEIRRPTEERLLAIPPPCVAAQRQMKTKAG